MEKLRKRTAKKCSWEMDITGKDGPGEKRIRGYSEEVKKIVF